MCQRKKNYALYTDEQNRFIILIYLIFDLILELAVNFEYCVKATWRRIIQGKISSECVPGEKKYEFCLESNDFHFVCAGVWHCGRLWAKCGLMQWRNLSYLCGYCHLSINDYWAGNSCLYEDRMKIVACIWDSVSVWKWIVSEVSDSSVSVQDETMSSENSLKFKILYCPLQS